MLMDFLFMEDSELLQIYFVEGRKNYAFNMIVRKYSERLYWQIRRIVLVHEDSNDVLQNTFIKVWKGLAKFRQDANLYTWMYRIATNEALNFIKKEKKQVQVDESALTNSLKQDPYFNADEAYEKFLLAIRKLPEKQQLVFNLKYFDELKYKEIAELIGGTEGSLKASYFHAVKKIEKELDIN